MSGNIFLDKGTVLLKKVVDKVTDPSKKAEDQTIFLEEGELERWREIEKDFEDFKNKTPWVGKPDLYPRLINMRGDIRIAYVEEIGIYQCLTKIIDLSQDGCNIDVSDNGQPPAFYEYVSKMYGAWAKSGIDKIRRLYKRLKKIRDDVCQNSSIEHSPDYEKLETLKEKIRTGFSEAQKEQSRAGLKGRGRFDRNLIDKSSSKGINPDLEKTRQNPDEKEKLIVYVRDDVKGKGRGKIRTYYCKAVQQEQYGELRNTCARYGQLKERICEVGTQCQEYEKRLTNCLNREGKDTELDTFCKDLFEMDEELDGVLKMDYRKDGMETYTEKVKRFAENARKMIERWDLGLLLNAGK